MIHNWNGSITIDGVTISTKGSVDNWDYVYFDFLTLNVSQKVNSLTLQGVPFSYKRMSNGYYQYEKSGGNNLRFDSDVTYTVSFIK